MSIYERLTRHSKHELDQKRKQLGAAIKSLEALNHELQTIEAQRQSELIVSSQHPELTSSVGGYLQKYKQRKEHALENIAKAQERVRGLEAELYESFQTHKRYESAADAHQMKVDYELKLKTQAALDELGIQKHFRLRRQ